MSESVGITEREIQKYRAETEGTRFVAHFNNAGSSLVPDVVRDAMIDYLIVESRMGGYEANKRYQAAFEKVYHAIASLIGAESANNIALVESATIAWYKAFHSLGLKKEDKILTSHVEYGSNFIGMLQAKALLGVEIIVVPSDSWGQVDVQALESLIDEKVALIAITHIPTNGGLVNPAEEIGEVARKHNIPYLLDACQAVGQYPLDVQKIGCDFLAATGRKFLRAPRGTGFLYVSPRMMDKVEPPFPDNWSASWETAESYAWREGATRFENFENSRAACLGLGKSVDYILEIGIDNIWQRVQLLADQLREKLSAVPEIAVKDLGKVKCGIVTFVVEGAKIEAVQAYLAKNQINVSLSTPASTRLDMEERELDGVVRASVHYYNTEKEIDRLIAVLRSFISKEI